MLARCFIPSTRSALLFVRSPSSRRRLLSTTLSLPATSSTSLNGSIPPSPSRPNPLSSSPLSAERSKRRATAFASKGKDLKDFLVDDHAGHHHEHGGKVCTKVSRCSVPFRSAEEEGGRAEGSSGSRTEADELGMMKGCLNCTTKAAKEQATAKLG
ncbi:hypothetical protein BCR35DRAFT_308976 [Leucosporidium creatinivorum]|uniref:Uncharacterized protein n=1 Tax=Leucosporidium creatinivorum TaxID=106004 RepID=A0A1Y2DUC1_9BASI|nr:hypothetical protein BCR35DRAFT_308976 [Leucosporidium creatinivorum]